MTQTFLEDIPEFLEIQRNSFLRILEKDLIIALEKINPISTASGSEYGLLFYPKDFLLVLPENTITEAFLEGKTYGCKIYVPAIIYETKIKHFSDLKTKLFRSTKKMSPLFLKSKKSLNTKTIKTAAESSNLVFKKSKDYKGYQFAKNLEQVTGEKVQDRFFSLAPKNWLKTDKFQNDSTNLRLKNFYFTRTSDQLFSFLRDWPFGSHFTLSKKNLVHNSKQNKTLSHLKIEEKISQANVTYESSIIKSQLNNRKSLSEISSHFLESINAFNRPNLQYFLKRQIKPCFYCYNLEKPQKSLINFSSNNNQNFTKVNRSSLEFRKNTKPLSKKEWVCIGTLPLMTPRGHFIINGSHRIVVSQMSRAPGLYYQTGDKLQATIVPTKGAWLRMSLKLTDTGEKKVWVRITPQRKMPYKVFSETYKFLEDLNRKNISYKNLKPSGLGQGIGQRLSPLSLNSRFTKGTGESLALKASETCFSVGKGLSQGHAKGRGLAKGAAYNPKGLNHGSYTSLWVSSSKFLNLTYKNINSKIKHFDKQYAIGVISGQINRTLLQSSSYTLGSLGRKRINERLGINQKTGYLTSKDISLIKTSLIKLANQDQSGFNDDIDHLENRRVRTCGELLQSEMEVGFSRLKKNVIKQLEECLNSNSTNGPKNIRLDPFNSSIKKQNPLNYSKIQGSFSSKGLANSQNLFLDSVNNSKPFTGLALEPFGLASACQKTSRAGLSRPLLKKNKPFSLAFLGGQCQQRISKPKFKGAIPWSSPRDNAHTAMAKTNGERSFGLNNLTFNLDTNLNSIKLKFLEQLYVKKQCSMIQGLFNLEFKNSLIVDEQQFYIKSLTGITNELKNQQLKNAIFAQKSKNMINDFSPAQTLGQTKPKLFLSESLKNKELNINSAPNFNREISGNNIWSPSKIVGAKAFTGALREFFGSNPLSQYMDQTNPLAEITHKRRLSSLGPGGVDRASAGIAIRGIHPSHYGRICPIETPEGKNAGLVNSMTMWTRVNSDGFLETPYLTVKGGSIMTHNNNISPQWRFVSTKNESSTKFTDNSISKASVLDLDNLKFHKHSFPLTPIKLESNSLSYVGLNSLAFSPSPEGFKDPNVKGFSNGLNHWACLSTPKPKPFAMLKQTLEALRTRTSQKGPLKEFQSKAYQKENLKKNSQELALWASYFKLAFESFGAPIGQELIPINFFEKDKVSQNTGNSMKIVASDLKISESSFLPNILLPYRNGSERSFERNKRNFMDLCAVSPMQNISVATSLIPFLEHDDATRALMGSNMQRQAVPLLKAQAPLVRTGLEGKVVGESGHALQANCSGLISRATKSFISIDSFNKKPLSLQLINLQVSPRKFSFLKELNPNLNLCKVSKLWSNGYLNKTKSKTYVDPIIIKSWTKLFFKKSKKKSKITSLLNFCLEEAKTEFSNPVFIKTNSSKKLVWRKNWTIDRQRQLLSLQGYTRSNQGTICVQRPAVQEGNWVQKGDLIGDCSASLKGVLALGQNIVVAYLPMEGFNFEDAIVVSDRLVHEELYTSIHIQRVEFDIDAVVKKHIPPKIKLKKQKSAIKTKEQDWITLENPHLLKSEKTALNSLGIIKIGSWVGPGDVLVSKVFPVERKMAPSRHLLSAVFQEKKTKTIDTDDTSLRVPKGIHGRVINVKIVGNGAIIPFNTSKEFSFKKFSSTIGMKPYGLVDHRASPSEKQNLELKTGNSSSKKTNQRLPFAFVRNIISANTTRFSRPNGYDYINSKSSDNYKKELINSINAFYDSYHSLSLNSIDLKLKSESLQNLRPFPKVFDALGLSQKSYSNSHFLNLKTFKGKNLKPVALRKPLKPFGMLKQALWTSSRSLLDRPWRTGNLKPSGLAQSLGFNLKPLNQKLLNNQFYCKVVIGPLNHKPWAEAWVKTRTSFLPFNSSPLLHNSVPNFTFVADNKIQNKESWIFGNFKENLGQSKFLFNLILNKKILGLGSKPIPVNPQAFWDKTSKGFIEGPWTNLLSSRFKIKNITNNQNLKDNLLFLHQDFQQSLSQKENLKGSIQGSSILPSNPAHFGQTSLIKDNSIDQFSKCKPLLGASRVKNSSGSTFQVNPKVRAQSTNLKNKEEYKIIQIRVYIAERKKLQVGDKMSGRHGNKGIVSTILPREDMPYLPDGTAVDMVLNPLGIPSRMNVGQVFECLLGLAASVCGETIGHTPFDEMYGPEASRSLVYLFLYVARLKTKEDWFFQPDFPGKTILFDGRTGTPFEQWVTVGRAYMLKLVHMVDEKIHARSIGPRSLVTQQPVKGRARGGGQRLGEMELWALEGFGAAYTLQEMLTIKSDDIKGRETVEHSIIFATTAKSHLPETFRMMLFELRCLCLNIELN